MTTRAAFTLPELRKAADVARQTGMRLRLVPKDGGRSEIIFEPLEDLENIDSKAEPKEW